MDAEQTDAAAGAQLVDPQRLREQVQAKYREVASHPDAGHHFPTGRALASRLVYPAEVVDALPDVAAESFAGVGNPFSLRDLATGERAVDIGSGAGLDSFVATRLVGPRHRRARRHLHY